MENKMTNLKTLIRTQRIIGCAIEVHRTLGPAGDPRNPSLFGGSVGAPPRVMPMSFHGPRSEIRRRRRSACR
jgi:hypothetical protein